MRITSGILRGRVFTAPDIEVRPTKGQVKEAVFSSLGGSCDGLDVLDLFAGSGGLGIEALSRWAHSVTFVEKHPAVWAALKKNLASFKNDQLGRVACVKGDALQFAKRSAGIDFDLIFADPPYDLEQALPLLFEGIKTYSILRPDGWLVYEMRRADSYEVPEEWSLVREKVYGYTRVLFLKLNKERVT